MDPIDRRRLPVTQDGWTSLLVVIRPIFSGMLKAVFSTQWGSWDVHNVPFSICLWVYDVIDLFWGPESKAQDTGHSRLTKGKTLQLQFVSFLATIFVLGPGWPWVILIFKITLGVIIVVATLRTSARLINFEHCPKWIQTTHAKYSILFPVYRKVAIDTAIRTAFDAYDNIDAVRWYTTPWVLRLVGQCIEERFSGQREEYRYTDLESPSMQIRLLRIHRQLLFWGHVRCSMQTFSLNEVPEYEALSYRWGFGSEGIKLQYCTIFVDGKTLRVPKSAWELLHARTSRYTDRLVWIDSICINQEKKAEKVEQIPLMDQIYTKAERTVVWPGDRFDSGMASRMLLRLYCTNYTFNAKDEEFLLFFEYEIVRRGWQAMIALFENPYFTRIWCVQEVALGKRVEVVHGNKDIHWEIFVETLKSYTHPRRASLLAWSTKDAMDRAISPNAPGGPSGIMVMEHIRQQQQHAGATAKALHIGLLLVSCAEFEATEAKDRIFGINGLIFGSHKVTPNYDLTNSQVFAAASILALQQSTYPFAALVYAGIGWGPLEANLPSWVVNWERSYNHATTWSPQLRDLITTGQSSATHLPSEIAIDDSKGRLRIKGFRVDAIWSQTSPATRLSATGERTTRFQRLVMRSRWYLDAANLSRARFEDYPFSAKLREEAFWRTIITDLSMTGRPAPQYFEEMHVWYQKWCQARLSMPLNDSIAWTKHILSTPEVYSLWPTTLEQRGRVSDFVSLVASAISGRRFAVTESGLMCLTPTESKEGDLVVIFHGAPTPFLLRTMEKGDLGSGVIDDTYQLVGECYVHGFMDRFDRISGFSPPSTETFTIV